MQCIYLPKVHDSKRKNPQIYVQEKACVAHSRTEVEKGAKLGKPHEQKGIICNGSYDWLWCFSYNYNYYYGYRSMDILYPEE